MNTSFNPIGGLLKNKEELFQQLTQPKKWIRTLPLFIMVSILGLAGFGMVVGLYVHHWDHSFILAWKMIVLLWGSLFICLPALYVFGTIRGSRVTLPQLLFLVTGAFATSGIVLLALTPLTAFFTWSANGQEFLIAMNGIFIGISILFGLFFLEQGLLHIHRKRIADGQPSKTAIDIIGVWMILFVIVLFQMSVRLGPWYEYRSIPVEYRLSGMNNFPENPQGEFIKEPTLQTNEQGEKHVVWQVPDKCEFNEMALVEDGYTMDNGKTWGGATVTCNWKENMYECVALVGDEGATKKYRAQVSNKACHSNGLASVGYVSQPIDLEF